MDCGFCHGPVPDTMDRCPHCAQPGLTPPNVRAADGLAEREALAARYETTLADARLRGVESAVLALQSEVQAISKVVINRPFEKLLELATSDEQVYATFYQLAAAGAKIPSGKGWDLLREQADSALFSGYKEQVRFGAITLDGKGIERYGNCSIVLRTGMISGRTSLFSENTAVWFQRLQQAGIDVERLPPGHRATWDTRGQLAAAKLGARVGAATPPPISNAQLLVHQGATANADDFIEAHVFGPVTRRTFECVLLHPAALHIHKRSTIRALAAKLRQVGCEVVP